MNPGTSGSQRTVRRALVAGGVVVCLAGATVSTVAALDARSDAAESRADRDAIELLQIRSQLRRALIAETNTLMLTVFDEASDADLARQRDDRIKVLRSSRDRIDEVSRGDGPIASEALALSDALSRDELTDDEADPATLFEGSWFTTVAGERPDQRTPPEQLAIADLASLDSIGGLVLNDALDAAWVMAQPTVPELLTDYVQRAEPYIRSDGGYLGSDSGQPLVDAWVFRDRAPEPHPAVDGVITRVTESRLWEYDQWIQSWQDVDPDQQPGPPPLALAELVGEAKAVDTDLRVIIDAELESAHTSSTRSAATSQRTATVLIIVASLLALTGIAPMVVGLVRRLRTFRHHADQIARDPLTGAGNRLQLDVMAATVGRAAPDHHHVVVAVDLDRFKLVNDTWGHAVGDQVLVDIARLLDDVVRRWQEQVPGTTGAVIRMGGDEFLLTLHTPRPIDLDAVRADLDRVRTTTVVASGQRVELRFSMGLASAQGACNLAELLSKADLAAYEEKAERARALSRMPSTGPAWSVRQPV